MENPHREQANCPTVKFTVSKEDFMVYTLAKAGWYGGNPSAIYTAPCDEVIKAYHFEIMTRDYKNTAYEMNKAEK